MGSSCKIRSRASLDAHVWQQGSLFPYWTLPKNRDLQLRARELRKQGILSEVRFWQTFKNKNEIVWDIDRQVIIGNYIVDFFIPELGLVFEIGGSSHNATQEYDKDREDVLRVLGLEVIHFTSTEVLCEMVKVRERVANVIKTREAELRSQIRRDS